MKYLIYVSCFVSIGLLTGCATRQVKPPSSCQLTSQIGTKKNVHDFNVLVKSPSVLKEHGVWCSPEKLFGFQTLKGFAEESSEEWIFSIKGVSKDKRNTDIEISLYPKKEGRKSERLIQKGLTYDGQPCEYLLYNRFKFTNIQLSDAPAGELLFSCKE